MNEVIETWFNKAKTYPPAEIFFEKYGKEAKAEERLKGVCEEVYRFCFPENQKNPLGDLGASYRDFEVAYIMGFEGMKPEYIQKVKDKFLEDVKFAITALDNLFKKDQVLQQYYAPWKVKFSEINSIVFDMTKDYL
ncbi:hypothetical protein pEaSNUABM19_00440 [Erwinia phage pEa_SNUABM_19]|uniref:Uncharacterized protein n=1 Tax=Erwinia phage pEa_SNUABM_12 TaxID=2768773 RepID=A0A7L8ZMV8_9CAUD|nr:hypothetical protein pEaSNUABM12_00440 [Erwinia phage pEa_SNUABM_12]QXO11577.1 hypothetical protein pEaSNUABM19_00440 [Erwinia phage pEa_SNUABM_19]